MLISGEGSNLQALIDATRAREIAGEIVAVVSNRGAARGLERARAAGIPRRASARAARRRARRLRPSARGRARASTRRTSSCSPASCASSRRELVARFAGRMLNIHPSLLPKYPGLDTHKRVLESGDRAHGATVHFVTADLDAGPAVIQYRIAVRPNDTRGLPRGARPRGRARDLAARRRLVRHRPLEARTAKPSCLTASRCRNR